MESEDVDARDKPSHDEVEDMKTKTKRRNL
jgi:hypothetical protein